MHINCYFDIEMDFLIIPDILISQTISNSNNLPFKLLFPSYLSSYSCGNQRQEINFMRKIGFWRLNKSKNIYLKASVLTLLTYLITVLFNFTSLFTFYSVKYFIWFISKIKYSSRISNLYISPNIEASFLEITSVSGKKYPNHFLIAVPKFLWIAPKPFDD